jgi:energy-coupling factor transport system ATP-binding protein
LCGGYRTAAQKEKGGSLMALLEVKNLSVVYGKGTPFEKAAVQDVNFSIEAGEFIGVIGHTGSGKSTLIQTLNGLIKPTNGQVLLEDHDIWAEPKKIRAVRFKVGMVFQYPENQLFEETVLKDISFGPGNMGLTAAEIETRARNAAKFVGLPDALLEKSPFELSGGEKRRVAIAGVIAMDPDVLILDEPTAGLDPAGRDVLLSQLLSYHAQRHNTVLLVSHSMEDVARVADRVLVMNNSHLEMFDKTANVFAQDERLEQIGLKVPQITKIMSILKSDGYPVETVLTMEQAVTQLLSLVNKGGAAV